VSYFNFSRPHQGVQQSIPGAADRECPQGTTGKIVARPILGGLHHDYTEGCVGRNGAAAEVGRQV
jgi:hypothetical protein